MTDLESLGRRIELLTVDPGAIDAPFVRLARPLLASLGFTPKVEITHARSLLKCLEEPPATLSKAFERALGELESNVTSVERATVVGGRALVSHAAWLRRLYEVLVRVERALAEPEDAVAQEAARAVEPMRLLPPLGLREVTIDSSSNEVVSPDVRAADLMAVELGAIDHVLDASNEEGELLARRRRLLEAARQMLLDASAAAPLDEAGVEARRRWVAREIAQLDRLQAAGLAPDVALTHQLREAQTRGEYQRAHAALLAMHGPAIARGDFASARLSGAAMRAMWSGGDPRGADARQASSQRSAEELFGGGFGARVKEAYARGRLRYEADKSAHPDARDAAQRYMTEAATGETLHAAISVDGCFETGGALVPARITEHLEREREVSFPTPELVLLPATQPDHIADAVIEDPRRIVLDLAAGRLLARRFVQRERVPRTRDVMQGEVRVYLLDGSGSMIGPRARVRDALLLAELATLKTRAMEHGRSARVTLFFRYFDTAPRALTRVTSPLEADAAMMDVLSTIRTGGTDIQAALLSSIEVMKQARANDPDLARGHLVLVTDGESPVDGDRVIAARDAALDRMPIGMSVIALGQQNDVLREIVRKQRAAGEKAFYHFVPDDHLEHLVRGELDEGPALHLPPVAAGATKDLGALLGGVVDELTELARSRDAEAMASLDDRYDAEAELGLKPGQSMSEGERAKARAVLRDRISLEGQFDRWFPRHAGPHATPAGGADAEAVVVVLATVAEVLDTVGGNDLSRRADAIDLLDRLLPDSRLSPARWREVTARPSAPVASALAAARAAAKADAPAKD